MILKDNRGFEGFLFIPAFIYLESRVDGLLAPGSYKHVTVSRQFASLLVPCRYYSVRRKTLAPFYPSVELSPSRDATLCCCIAEKSNPPTPTHPLSNPLSLGSLAALIPHTCSLAVVLRTSLRCASSAQSGSRLILGTVIKCIKHANCDSFPRSNWLRLV